MSSRLLCPIAAVITKMRWPMRAVMPSMVRPQVELAFAGVVDRFDQPAYWFEQVLGGVWPRYEGRSSRTPRSVR